MNKDLIKEIFNDPGIRFLIEQNEWEEFYEYLDEYLSTVSLDGESYVKAVGDVSYFLLTLGINPLHYMTYIPWGYLAYTDIEKIDTPDNIKRIDSYAFYHCSKLKTITVPSSVVYIGEKALSYTNIDAIYYKGTPKEWEEVNIQGSQKILGKGEVHCLGDN